MGGGKGDVIAVIGSAFFRGSIGTGVIFRPFGETRQADGEAVVGGGRGRVHAVDVGIGTCAVAHATFGYIVPSVIGDAASDGGCIMSDIGSGRRCQADGLGGCREGLLLAVNRPLFIDCVCADIIGGGTLQAAGCRRKIGRRATGEAAMIGHWIRRSTEDEAGIRERAVTVVRHLCFKGCRIDGDV